MNELGETTGMGAVSKNSSQTVKCYIITEKQTVPV